MKLQHLAIGARFEYEGVVYVKTGPLTAASEEGGQRIIPRYAILRPLDVPAAESSQAPASHARETVLPPRRSSAKARIAPQAMVYAPTMFRL